MKKIVYISLMCSLLFALGGCNGQSSSPHRGSRWEATLSLADSLMRTRPDSALRLLYSLIPEGKPFPLGEGWGEAYYLLLLDAQNKCDTVFRSDTLQRALVSYYDRHGTPNERMRAYYLLGRACHDMGESPRALDCYQQAIDCADTTSTDCDYYTLMCIHSQKSEIYHWQQLPSLELKELTLSEKYAWLAGDTVNALLGSKYKSRVFYQTNKLDSVIYYAQKGYKALKQNGYQKQAISCLINAIQAYIQKKDYKYAKHLFNLYEETKEYTDSLGNAKPGYEIYYYNKGMYFLGVNHLDSAEYYFRKELETGKDENNQIAASKGLALVYSQQQKTDSALKYAMYSSETNDSFYKKDVAQHLQQMEAAYNYNAYKTLAKEKDSQAEKAYIRNIYLSALLILCLITSIIIIFYLRKNKKLKLEKAREEYRNAIILLNSRTEEIHALREQYDRQSQEYAEEQNIWAAEEAVLKNRVLVLEKQLNLFDEESIRIQIEKEAIYNKFKKSLKPKNGVDINKHDWEKLFEMVDKYLPGFSLRLRLLSKLNSEDYKVCVLLRLHFDLQDIRNLIGIQPSNLSHKRERLAKKIFKTDYSPTDFDKEIQKLY